MPDPRLAPSLIAVLAEHPPAALRHQAAVTWCRTTAELVVLAQDGRLRAAVIDGCGRGVDRDLVTVVRHHCPVVVVDRRSRSADWPALGAAVVPEPPTTLGSLLAAVEAAESADTPAPMASAPAAVERASLVAVLEAPGGDGAAASAALAGSLAARASPSRPVVLADLTLDAPHRAIHGLGRHVPGLSELLAAGRFEDPPPATAGTVLHRLPDGVLLLPGLRRHHDWVSLGRRSVQAAVDALRAGTGAVVAHIDHDLEGEAETGSFDVEDRNLLARSVVRAAGLVVVCGSASSAGRVGLDARLEQLAVFGVPAGQTVTAVGSRRRSARRVARAVGSLLDAGAGSSAIVDEVVPERIVPGTLGHWAQLEPPASGIDGWITPRVPQQP